MFQVRDVVKEKILYNFIEKSYEQDIESLINGRRRWKKTGQVFETMSKVFLALGGIISFSSGYFDIRILSFLSGTISVISLSFLQFSSFCYLENKKQSNELNITLKKLGLDTVPELSRDIDNNILMRNSPMNYEQINNKNKATPIIYIPDINTKVSNTKLEFTETKNYITDNHSHVSNSNENNRENVALNRDKTLTRENVALNRDMTLPDSENNNNMPLEANNFPKESESHHS